MDKSKIIRAMDLAVFLLIILCTALVFQDGIGIEINKQDFPIAVYGKLDTAKMISEGHEIKLTDYNEVMDSIKSDLAE